MDIRKSCSCVRFYLWLRKYKLTKKIGFIVLKILGAEIPLQVEIGRNLFIPHIYAIVIHPETKIGNNVCIHQGVTIGRRDDYVRFEDSEFKGIIIEDNVYIGAGAKIICEKGTLVVRNGTKIGANAVLLNSTGNNETWVGIPARKIK